MGPGGAARGVAVTAVGRRREPSSDGGGAAASRKEGPSGGGRRLGRGAPSPVVERSVGTLRAPGGRRVTTRRR
ncbi:hypothetical protein FTX61_00910 [Nitriliruptoraceae bacterium ZYF776]|nr:hypothetical protein [Profundirhabdus halotolerans]